MYSQKSNCAASLYLKQNYDDLSPDSCARIYRPSFHENKHKTLVFTIENERFGWFSRKQGL